MKSVIVVDDEISIRTGLSVLISRVGRYKVVAECKDGQEAYKAILKHRPDIVFTDIRMPVMDGLKLIEKCAEAEINSKFIILTGYGEFEYAQAALRLSAFDYVLKPVDHDGFLKLLDRVSDTIDAEKDQQRIQKINACLAYLDQTGTSTDSCMDSIRQLGIRLNNYQAISINTGLDDPSDSKLDEITKAVDALLESFNESEFIAFFKNGMVTAILSDSSAAADSVPEYINLILSRLQSQFGCLPLIGVSRQCDKLSGISDCYQQSLTALKESIYHKDRQVFFYTPMMRSSIPPCQYYSKELELLKTAITDCEPEKASEIIDGFFKPFEERGIPASANYSFAVEIISYTGSVAGGNQAGKIPSERLHLLTDLNQISNYLKVKAIEAIEILREAKLKNYGKIISDILTYINMNIEKDLTIGSVCSRFYINESYFCKLFKSKTGLSFNKYLTELKIKKAKDLLRYDNLRIYEVAKLVGFNDYKYFLKVFKKVTGETPYEFKEELSSSVL